VENTGALLHFARVTAEGAAPTRWMLVLHGILGSGGNLRTLAKRLATAAPDWGFALVDLRMHGMSQEFAPPHTLEAAAADLFAVEAALGGDVRAVMGHSFGGKTAIAFAGQRILRGEESLEHLIVLDASPSARRPRGGETEAIVRMLETMPETFESREAFTAAVKGQGYSQPIADWLAMNVRREGELFRLRLDLKAIRAMLEDYAATDLWPVIEDGQAAKRVDFVIAGKSNTLDAEDRKRLAELETRGLVHVQVLDSTHWVHVDAPDALFELVRDALIGQEGSP
jgi:esterase